MPYFLIAWILGRRFIRTVLWILAGFLLLGYLTS